MSKRRWLIPLAALGGAVAWSRLRCVDWEQLANDVRWFGAPNATVYDAFASAVFGRFYNRVVSHAVRTHPAGQVLDVGCGPGILAVRMAQAAPGMSVTALDISPDMVERARWRASAAEVAERVRFEVADVAALPFPDGRFDLIVSTYSLHHWTDPAGGLREIYRVLKPGGEARIYDIAGWILRALSHGEAGLSSLIGSAPFSHASIATVWRIGPVPISRLLTLRRD